MDFFWGDILYVFSPDKVAVSQKQFGVFGIKKGMAIIDLFSEQSDLYAAARPQYPQAVYEFLASCLDRRERVWDCATGNGQAAIALAHYFTHVEATDVSAQQIANALPAANVHYSVQPAESTTFPDAYFDAIVVAQALHWFDLDRFWVEVDRLLRPGGIFATWSYTHFTIAADIDAVLKTTVLSPIQSYWSSRIQLMEGGYANIAFPFKAVATPMIAMQLSWNLLELLAYMRSWSATRQRIQAEGSQFFELASEQLASVWGDRDERKTVTMDFHLIVRHKE